MAAQQASVVGFDPGCREGGGVAIGAGIGAEHHAFDAQDPDEEIEGGLGHGDALFAMVQKGFDQFVGSRLFMLGWNEFQHDLRRQVEVEDILRARNGGEMAVDDISFLEGDEFSLFFPVIDEASFGQELEHGAEAVFGFAGAGGDGFDITPLQAEKVDQLVLFVDDRGAQHECVALPLRHG